MVCGEGHYYGVTGLSVRGGIYCTPYDPLGTPGGGGVVLECMRCHFFRSYRHALLREYGPVHPHQVPVTGDVLPC